MDDATEERHRLDTLHDEELCRTRKAQEQTRDHIARIQAQTREHRKILLDIEHQANLDAAITLQKALHEQHYQHRERILKLECQYASVGSGAEPGESAPESEDAESGNKATVEPGRELTMVSEDAGSSDVAAAVNGEEELAAPWDAGSGDVAAAFEGEEGLAASRGTASGGESSGDQVPKKGSRAEYFMGMAKKAADRSVVKKG